MHKRICIKSGGIEVMAVLNETATAQAIWDALPLAGNANTWGDEIYFPIPLELGTEQGQDTVELGDLGYWSPGSAFCIFFGPTPMSRGDKIRPASSVTVFGHADGDTTVLRSVPSGALVSVERR